MARRAWDATAGLTVTRLADSGGVVSFTGTPYACGRRWARTPIDVSIVAGSVQLSKDGKVIRVHPIRHDRSRELGAFANPKGTAPPQELRHRQHRLTIMSPGYRNSFVAQVPELDTSPRARPDAPTRGMKRHRIEPGFRACRRASGMVRDQQQAPRALGAAFLA